MTIIRLSAIVFSFATTFNNSTPATGVPFKSEDTTAIVEMLPAIPEDKKSVSVEPHVKAYFADIPVLIKIAKCESTFRHADSEGEVVRGVVNKYDVGVMQINEQYHKERAEKMGIELHTLEGNLAYARFLYENHGTSPWSASELCWGKKAVELAKK